MRGERPAVQGVGSSERLSRLGRVQRRLVGILLVVLPSRVILFVDSDAQVRRERSGPSSRSSKVKRAPAKLGGQNSRSTAKPLRKKEHLRLHLFAIISTMLNLNTAQERFQPTRNERRHQYPKSISPPNRRDPEFPRLRSPGSIFPIFILQNFSIQSFELTVVRGESVEHVHVR